jgi:hypothetical protein
LRHTGGPYPPRAAPALLESEGPRQLGVSQ